MPTDTDTTTDAAPGAFASVTSDDVLPGETPNDARKRRRAEAQRARRAAGRVKPDRPPQAPRAEPAAPVADEPRGPGRPKGSGTKAAKRAAGVTAFVSVMGVAVSVRNEADGAAILAGAGKLGDSLAKLAEQNAHVARALDSLTEGSAWLDVAFAVGAIALPIVQNHGGLRRLGAGAEVEPEPEPATVFDPLTDPSSPDFDPTQIVFRAV